MIDLATLSRQQLRAWLAESGQESRERDLWVWLHRRGGRNLGELAESGRFPSDWIRGIQNGTVVALNDGMRVESVFIPEPGRGTLCVSSQVGCSLTCRFCHTGTQPLARNLTSGEIVGQVLLTRDRLGDHGIPADSPRRLTNVVFMGMGEPLLNYEAVADAVRVISDREGIAISRRRITVSTSGVVPAMERCGRELGGNLAVSLHAARDELRDRILPLNRRYPLAELMRACRGYPGLSNNRRILFAYTLLRGVNDSERDAFDLVRLLDGIPAKVNLIPFNAWPGAPFEPSPPDRIRSFQRLLLDRGISATVRKTRGSAIAAACGLLKTAEREGGLVPSGSTG